MKRTTSNRKAWTGEKVLVIADWQGHKIGDIIETKASNLIAINFRMGEKYLVIEEGD